MSKKKGHSKRTGSKGVQTKRSPMNKHNFETKVGYAVRMLNREKYFNAINEHYKIKNKAAKFYMDTAPQAEGAPYKYNGGMSISITGPSTQWPVY